MAGESFQEKLDSLKEFDFNDLDFENVGSWPFLVKVIAWTLAFAIVVFGGYKYDTADMRTSLEAETAKEGTLKQEYESMAFQAANLDALRKQMEEMEESFGALISQLPSDTEVPGLLEDISDRGAQSHLEFESITLKPESVQEFYVELPIEIKVRGNYHDIGGFISGVAGLPRIVTLHDFEIIPDGETATGLYMTILAKTYRYKGEEDGEEGAS